MNTPTLTPRASFAPAETFLPFWHRLLHGVVGVSHCVTCHDEQALVPRDTSPMLLATASVQLARCIFDDLAEQQVLLIGIGDLIEPYAERFCAQHPRGLTVVSHTESTARQLARRIGGRTVRLHELPDQLPLHDIVVTCTGSPLPILGKGMVERAIRYRRHRPILIVDLAIRQDVEPEVGDLDDVYLYRGRDLVQFPAGRC